MTTIRDVAEHAGVSVTTVSHVINETRKVSDELRKRVLVAMDELGYQPNLLARSLRRGKTHTIGMIVPNSANPFFAEVGRGVEDTSFEHGYSLILCNCDGDAKKELLYANLLAEKQVDGILFVSCGVNTDHIHALQTIGMPLVVVDRTTTGLAVDSVLIKNARGGWLATRHLLELGHRRIGCITGPSDGTPGSERADGYRLALDEWGISADESLIIRGDYQYESGHRAARQLLAMSAPPTAIFACNDLMAVGVVSEAVELGYRIPADLSVIGFDDVRLASFANPPLTTVSQPKHEMGVLAATMLLERMHDRDMQPRQKLLDTELVIRRSTARVATTNAGNV